MKAAGADIEYLRVDGARHGLAYNEKLEMTDPAIEQFFAEHLKLTLSKIVASPLHAQEPAGCFCPTDQWQVEIEGKPFYM